MGFIYCIKGPNGRKYIGQTVKTVKKRWGEHIYEAFNPNKFNTCPILNNAIRKYGKDQFKVKEIKEVDNEELDRYEIKYIDKYGTKYPNGYNIRDGGNGKLSEATKEKMRKRRRENCHWTGKHHKEESKEKIRLALTGRKYSRKVRKNEEISKDLPKYISYYSDARGRYGYYVAGHPYENKVTKKSFISMNKSMEEKLQMAKEYLEWLETNPYNIEQKSPTKKQVLTKQTKEEISKKLSEMQKGKEKSRHRRKYDIEGEELPKYIYKTITHSRGKIYEGYGIASHPKMNGKSVKILTNQISVEDKLRLALKFLELLDISYEEACHFLKMTRHKKTRDDILFDMKYKVEKVKIVII